jgi:RNA polymerase sigma-70 factor (ECF subfamily)
MSKIKAKEQRDFYTHAPITSKNNMVSLEAIVKRYYSSIYHLTLSIIDDPDDAEDVAQETFIAASMNLNGFRGDADIKTWLYSIAINRSRGHLRKRKTQRNLTSLLQGFQRLRDLSLGPEENALKAEVDDQLWSIIDSMSDKHRIPIILRYVHQLPISEIAEILEIKEGTVHSRLFYAHQKIRGEMKRLVPLSIDIK